MKAEEIYIISKEWIKKDNESEAVDCIKLMSEDLERRMNYSSDKKAIEFARYIHNNPFIFNNGWSMEMVLDYYQNKIKQAKN